MLTPMRRLRTDIEQRVAVAETQAVRTRTGYAELRGRWHNSLGRPRNVALGFAAGLTYGLMRSTRVQVPGRVELWRLARPLLLSSAMAWWGRQHAD